MLEHTPGRSATLHIRKSLRMPWSSCAATYTVAAEREENGGSDTGRQGVTEERAASSEACGGCGSAHPADLLLLCDGCAEASPTTYENSCTYGTAFQTYTQHTAQNIGRNVKRCHALMCICGTGVTFFGIGMRLLDVRAAGRTAQPRGTPAVCPRRCHASRQATGCALPAPRMPPSPAPCPHSAQSGEQAWVIAADHVDRQTHGKAKRVAVRAREHFVLDSSAVHPN